jgi:heme-degrading monooxygenase HmoA
MSAPARTPGTPYWAVIFTTRRTAVDAGYAATAARMEELASRQPGYLGIESVREGDSGITVSYWESLEAIEAWRKHVEHRAAQERGIAEWYRCYELRVARVERAHGFGRDGARGEGA